MARAVSVAPKFLRPAQLRQFFVISPSTYARWRRAGLPVFACKHGAPVRHDVDRVLAWLQGAAAADAAEAPR